MILKFRSCFNVHQKIGFQFQSKSDFLEFRTVSGLIRRRELLLRQFHDARINGVDKMSEKDLLMLYRRASEEFILQYKVIHRSVVYFKFINEI